LKGVRRGKKWKEEYKYTFSNLKNELKELDTQQLKEKLEEQQKELMKKECRTKGRKFKKIKLYSRK